VNAFFHAVEVFWNHLSSVRWEPLAIALALNLLRLVFRALAWRNILGAAYPEARIRRAQIFGAYMVGVGVNAIAPARAGEPVKLYLVRHRVEGSTYPTLASSLLVETLFDFVVAGAIFVWAFSVGVIPSRAVIERLPSVDWSWPLRHPSATLVIVGVVIVLIFAGIVYARLRIEDLREQFGRGFAILEDRLAYLRLVVSWQGLSWVARFAATYFFLEAFRLTPSLHNALVVQTVESVSTLLPITPGGAGTKQGLTTYALRDEFSVSAVISFSVGMNIALVVANVVVGAIALLLMARTLRWRRLAKLGRAEQQETKAA
jgi:glycosyltransferase 2 family protein